MTNNEIIPEELEMKKLLVVDSFYKDQIEAVEYRRFDNFLKEIGPGWHTMVKYLLQVCKANGVQMIYVKEKFGGLRFVVNNAPKYVQNIIKDAEEMSFKICENCGDVGKPKEDAYGWIRTLCTLCRIQQEKENDEGIKRLNEIK